MGDGIPHLPGSLTLTQGEFEEFREIVAESKENELQVGLGSQHPRGVSNPTSPGHDRKGAKGSDEVTLLEAIMSLNWLMNGQPEIHNRTNNWRGGCYKFCCCCGRWSKKDQMNYRTKSAIAAIRAWGRNMKNGEDFVALMTLVTRNAEETVQGLKSILTKLSYEGDVEADIEKLSIVGSYLWLITYGMQHIPISRPSDAEKDPDRNQFHPNPRINTRLMETHEAYEEIGGIVQEWVPLALDFLQKSNDLRQNGAKLVRLFQGRFGFQRNPFKECPEVKPLEVHRNSLKVIPDMLEQVTSNRAIRPPSESSDKSIRGQRGHFDRGQQEKQPLRVQWSPVVVLVQPTPNGRWEVFSSLETPERVELVAMFIQEPLRLLNSCVKTFRRSITASDVVDQPDSERPSSIFEVTCALLLFTSSAKFQKLTLDSAGVESLGKTVETFWVTVDSLYETALKVSQLISETRDIVRSSYIYSDHFYHWTLKNFDLFDHPHQSPGQEERMRKFVSQVVGKGSALADVAKFYAIADFTTSHYQYVLQRRPISSHGVGMMLECWDDFKNEAWGLVEDSVDQRKLKEGSRRTKSRHFALTYRSSI